MVHTLDRQLTTQTFKFPFSCSPWCKAWKHREWEN